ncbi:MAG: hypothetical protein E7012_03840 [Alphaproteobacteria bacterium]|nr:hypothetical protein [Alphaproteobacteria bacterium]
MKACCISLAACFIIVFVIRCSSNFLSKRKKLEKHNQKLKMLTLLPDRILISMYCDKNFRWNMHVDADILLEVLEKRNLLGQARTAKILKTLKYKL